MAVVRMRYGLNSFIVFLNDSFCSIHILTSPNIHSILGIQVVEISSFKILFNMLASADMLAFIQFIKKFQTHFLFFSIRWSVRKCELSDIC